MEIPIYLAMTPAEFLNCKQLPPGVGWMACHFSPGGDGLCNLPEHLPEDSLLIFDDSTPYQNHDFDQILSQLSDAVSTLKPTALLLDFQRPDVEDVQALAARLTMQLPCPVVVSACYAANLACPVFLPPSPLWKPLSDHLAPYRGREIWLDAAPVCAQVRVTAERSQYIPQNNLSLSESSHFDPSLHCHYESKIEETQIIFNLFRGADDLMAWLEEGQTLGVSCAVGLYQELSVLLP